MRVRRVLALSMMIAGVVIVVLSAWSTTSHLPALNWLLGVVAGAILIIVGLVLLVAELMETWLTREQSVLVDGLQAG